MGQAEMDRLTLRISRKLPDAFPNRCMQGFPLWLFSTRIFFSVMPPKPVPIALPKASFAAKRAASERTAPLPRLIEADKLFGMKISFKQAGNFLPVLETADMYYIKTNTDNHSTFLFTVN